MLYLGHIDSFYRINKDLGITKEMSIDLWLYLCTHSFISLLPQCLFYGIKTDYEKALLEIQDYISKRVNLCEIAFENILKMFNSFLCENTQYR